MFDALLRLLTGADDARPDAPGDQRSDPAFALAVLLLETARSDDCVAEHERRMIERVLARRFNLRPFETARLVDAARHGAIRATDLYNSTRIVVQNFSEQERVGVIEMLWDVAYSDGELTGDEDALIRRVAGLLYVSDRDRGEAKRRARERAAGI
ncbi:MAG: TerB family tellurite resistance protein [Alphaproteobacteria bacterium]